VCTVVLVDEMVRGVEHLGEQPMHGNRVTPVFLPLPDQNLGEFERHLLDTHSLTPSLKTDAHGRAGEEDETTAADVREATVWIEGLDRINKALGGRGNGIRLCMDLSATPFYIQGSGNEVGKPFPWVVSDFSLLEAIEAGLVKVPQLPTEDGSGEDVPRYFNVWRWVQKQAQNDGHIGPTTVTEVMRYATAPIVTLAASWRDTLAKWQEHFRQGNRRDDVPPVFIIVCRDTTIAKAMYAWLAEGDAQYGAGVPEFRNAPGREMTVRIDSKVGEDIAAGGTSDETRRLRFCFPAPPAGGRGRRARARAESSSLAGGPARCEAACLPRCASAAEVLRTAS
jgi:hypothetical protein